MAHWREWIHVGTAVADEKGKTRELIPVRRLYHMKRTTKAFTLVEIMIVVAIIGILIAIAVPGFIRAREVSRRNSCQENLTKIDGAKATWALETNQNELAVPTWTDLVQPNQTGFLRFTPVCPINGTYTIGAVNILPSCDAVVSLPEFSHLFPVATGGGS